MKQNQFNRKERYGIRKFTIGVTSVVVGTIVFGVSPVLAQEQGNMAILSTENVEKEEKQPLVAEELKETMKKDVSDVNKKGLAAEIEHQGDKVTQDKSKQQATVETEKTDEKEKERKGSESISRDYYARELKNARPVIEKEDVAATTSNGQRVDLSSELGKIKELQNATVHMEFKPDANAPQFYNLFSVSSDKVRNEYFTMAVYNQTATLEGRGADGNQFYNSYNDAPLKVRSGQWNSVTFTVEKPTAELPNGRVRLYVNGALSRTSLKSGNFIKEMPDVNHMQIGATNRAGSMV
ncbi:sialidase domain-containing protein, partial [Streptococcus oralis]|uniref:sialidase domain-containing protein n=1 Tax=Streptococcus oralis TaxID=1303 RepID=UPI000B14B369